jgi:hypothetical protein
LKIIFVALFGVIFLVSCTLLPVFVKPSVIRAATFVCFCRNVHTYWGRPNRTALRLSLTREPISTWVLFKHDFYLSTYYIIFNAAFVWSELEDVAHNTAIIYNILCSGATHSTSVRCNGR